MEHALLFFLFLFALLCCFNILSLTLSFFPSSHSPSPFPSPLPFSPPPLSRSLPLLPISLPLSFPLLPPPLCLSVLPLMLSVWSWRRAPTLFAAILSWSQRKANRTLRRHFCWEQKCADKGEVSNIRMHRFAITHPQPPHTACSHSFPLVPTIKGYVVHVFVGSLMF